MLTTSYKPLPLAKTQELISLSASKNYLLLHYRAKVHLLATSTLREILVLEDSAEQAFLDTEKQVCFVTVASGRVKKWSIQSPPQLVQQTEVSHVSFYCPFLCVLREEHLTLINIHNFRETVEAYCQDAVICRPMKIDQKVVLYHASKTPSLALQVLSGDKCLLSKQAKVQSTPRDFHLLRKLNVDTPLLIIAFVQVLQIYNFQLQKLTTLNLKEIPTVVSEPGGSSLLVLLQSASLFRFDFEEQCFRGTKQVSFSSIFQTKLNKKYPAKQICLFSIVQSEAKKIFRQQNFLKYSVCLRAKPKLFAAVLLQDKLSFYPFEPVVEYGVDCGTSDPLRQLLEPIKQIGQAENRIGLQVRPEQLRRVKQILTQKLGSRLDVLFQACEREITQLVQQRRDMLEAAIERKLKVVEEQLEGIVRGSMLEESAGLLSEFKVEEGSQFVLQKYNANMSKAIRTQSGAGGGRDGRHSGQKLRVAANRAECKDFAAARESEAGPPKIVVSWIVCAA